MKNAFEKFSDLDGSYIDKYVAKDPGFYGTIQDHIANTISKSKTRGMDIGAGPGIGFRIMMNLNNTTTLYGYEPSKTHFDVIRMGLEIPDAYVSYMFPGKGISVRRDKSWYFADNVGIEEIWNRNEVDYILFLRSPHEIALSIGKEHFFSEFCWLLENLRDGGIVIIADPQYTGDVSPKIVEKVIAYQTKRIGHSHFPEDYISAQEMKSRLEKMGLELRAETILPKDDLLVHLRLEGFNLNESPCSFYVQTYKKLAKGSRE